MANEKSIEAYTLGELIADWGTAESLHRQAAEVAGGIRGPQRVGTREHYFQQVQMDLGEKARRCEARPLGDAGTQRLRQICLASGAEWSTAWVRQQRAGYCLEKNTDVKTADALSVEEFAEWLRPAAPPAAFKGQEKPAATVDNSDKTDLLVAAITLWHGYEYGSVKHYSPIAVTELARRAGVVKSTASKFFRNHFGGLDEYKAKCRSKTLASVLGPLNRETPAGAKRHEANLNWED
jgi:hypothetical protein